MSMSPTEIANKIQKKVARGEWTLDDVEHAVRLIRLQDQFRAARGRLSEPTGGDLPCEKKESHSPHAWGYDDARGARRFHCTGQFPYLEDDHAQDRVKVEEPESDIDELSFGEVVDEVVDRIFVKVDAFLDRIFDKR